MRQISESDPYLVIEQRGLRVLVTGILLALIMAMTFRAIFSPQRIKYEIERVIEESNPQKAEIKVEKAYLSLAQGWFPRLAVVIENLDIQSQDPCLYFARINAGSMILPVSLQSIFDRALVLKKVEIDHLVAHLKTDGVKCSFNSNSNLNSNSNSNLNDSAGSVPSAKSLSSSGSKVGNENTEGEEPSISGNNNGSKPRFASAPNVPLQSAPLVQTLSIEGSPLKEILLTHGELHFDSYPAFYLEIKKLNAQLVNQPERSAKIDGNLELIPIGDDRLIGWNSRLQVEATDSLVKSHFKGQWREGSINLNLDYKIKENDVDLKGDFKQIPLGQIFLFANKMGWLNEAPTARQSWISFHTDYQQHSKKDKHVNIKDVKVEGDFGDIKVPLIEAKGEPLVWEPLVVELNSVNITKLLAALDQPHPSSSLSSLGIFNGVVDLEGPRLKAARGELKGLEFVFSNKGIRDIQTVSNVHLELNETDNLYKGKLTQLELKEGAFKGQVDAVYNKLDSTTQVQVTLDELKLNPKVEKLMTNRGSISPLQGKLNFLLKNGERSQVQGLVKTESGQIEKIDFEKLKWEINSTNTESLWKISIQDLKLNSESQLLDSMQDILRVETAPLNMKNFAVKGKKTETGFEWTELQSVLSEPKVKISSQGSWDADGNLTGAIQIKSDKESRQVIISGTRENPQWN